MSEAKVFIVQSESSADCKVSFVNSDSNQKNQQLIQGGKLVSSESSADVKVFIVNSQSNAGIWITRKNFPRA
jgi:hypothetical protein